MKKLSIPSSVNGFTPAVTGMSYLAFAQAALVSTSKEPRVWF